MDIMQILDPELLPAIANADPETEVPADLPAARRQQTQWWADHLDVGAYAVAIEEREIPGPVGAPAFMVRIYRPKSSTRSGLLPAMVWIHGGGFIMGAPSENDIFCLSFVENTGCLIVSPDYRLAPEHPFPAGPEDCYAALNWLADSHKELGIDPELIGVGGFSAGGGLAAATALMARDRQSPKLAFQMPLSACLDDRHTTPSSQEITDGRIWNRDFSIKCWELYLATSNKDDISPYAVPSRSLNLAGLPPAYMGIGELDLMRDENIEYAMRLMQAGVTTELHVYPGAYHGFELMAPEAAVSQQAMKEYNNFFNRIFNRKS